MNRETKTFTVQIFGDEYVLISDEQQEHIIQSAACVDELMKEIALKSRSADAKKIAVLVALRIASKLLDHEAYLEQRKTKEDELLEQLEQTLQVFEQ